MGNKLSVAKLAEIGVDSSAQIETWGSIYKKSIKLAEIIIESYGGTEPGLLFDKVVTIPKGGLYPANIVTREIACRGIDILSAAMGFYASGANKPGRKISYGQSPTKKEVRGKNLLIIDEVCDSGKTLLDLVNRLNKLGAASVKTGVIHYKAGKSETGFIPDWYVEKTDSWIIYPWEINEYKGRKSVVRVMKHPV